MRGRGSNPTFSTLRDWCLMASIPVFQTGGEGSNPLSRLAHRSMQLYLNEKEEIF